ncbi:MAG: Ig-like domain-containing protein [Flavobacteriaceae bacterium]|nr:Ig-like domain-containing protein [Flavobacteriaceae bacterium]
MRLGLNILLLGGLLLTTVQCAKRASPTGGPRDSLPPVLINASPKLNTVFFDKEEFNLTFDEYVTLKDISKQLIISPPLSSSQYKVYPVTGASKKVTLKLLDSLLDNTTYTFNFGESIIDFNESNPSSYLTYTLSTGATIDSLYIKGRVTDAFERETERYISLQLYPVDSIYKDSVIFTEKPLYVTSTLDTTIFRFQNLRAGKYAIIALEDKAGNYFFDQNIDKIGFVDRLIELPQDSLLDFRLFQEKANFFWDKPYFINEHHIALAYYGEREDESYKMVSQVPESFESLVTQNRETDTLDYWFRGAELDSLQFEFNIKDSLQIKTVYFKNPTPDSLVVDKNTSGSLRLLEKFELKTNLPITEVNSEQVKVTNIDTLPVPASLKIQENYDRITVDFEVIPNDRYEITLLPNALVDFWGNTNDTLVYRTSTKKIEDYGNIFLRVQHQSPHPYIIELLKGDEVFRRYDTPLEGGNYSFKLLDAAKYRVRLIEDANQNKKWDTGNYLEKIQPEQVIYYWKEIDVRANWDMNETFNTSQNYPDLPESATASAVLEVPDSQVQP